MQTQKEEIRRRILEAAEEEFLTVGYRNSSMRTIAEHAGITPGNIYAYFSGKEAILDSIVVPALDDLNRLISDVSKGAAQMDEPTILELAQEITNLFLNHRTQFLILMNGCAGSRHEHMWDHTVVFIARRIEAEYLPKLPPRMQSRLLAETMAVSYLNGFFYLFQKFDGDEEKLRNTLKDFLILTVSK